jgi:dTDP-4-amino-4,6-dideoxygalactose transaminase
MDQDLVSKFEKEISKFFGSPYTVAVDCCTHAVELCLRYKKVRAATCPTNTYISIPFTLTKLGIKWAFENTKWEEFYYLGNTNIIDAAVLWRKDSYIPDTLMCLSFQFKKHLSLGRGGAILCDNEEDYINLKKMSYDGRLPNVPWAEQNISTIGYHYYMTPETASSGLEKLSDAKYMVAKKWTWEKYPYLPDMEVFK